MKRMRRAKAFALSLLSPGVAKLHNIVATTDAKLVPKNIRRSLYLGGYERQEAEACYAHLKPGDRVLELGGGVGVISVICAKICGSDAVLTYEANPRLEALIRENHRINGVAPELRMKAISATRDAAAFFANADILSSSFFEHKGGQQVSVPVDFIGDVCAAHQPTCIVCDIEGAEIDVLPAADLSGVRTLLVELHPRRVGADRIDALCDGIAQQGFTVDRDEKFMIARRV